MLKGLIRTLKRAPMEISIAYLDAGRSRWTPTYVQIEATSKCNLRCPGCSHSREKGVGQHLSTDQLQRILDRLPFPLNYVILSGVGEPLLNPDFFSLVDLLAERRISCHFFSNGTLLKPQRSDAILQRPNIISLTISCDGAEKTEFESLRLGANFEDWTQSVRSFVQRAKDERPALRIGMNTVINQQNINQLEDIIHLASELGMRGVHFLEPIPVDEIAAASIPSESELAAINFKELFELGRSLGVGVSWHVHRGTAFRARIRRCLHPWNTVFIRSNGNVQPCPALFGTDKAAVMGNIFQGNFSDIWNGDRYGEYRRTKKEGTNPLCAVCPYQ